MNVTKNGIIRESIRGSRLILAGAVLSMAAAAALSLVDPLIVRYVLDAVLAGKPVRLPGFLESAIAALGGSSFLARNLWFCALAFVAVGAVHSLFMFLRGALAQTAAERTVERLRNRLFQRLSELPFAYFGSASSGDLVQRCTSDVETVRRFLATQFVDIGQALSLLVLSLAAMLAVDAGMTLVCVPVIPVILGFSFLFFIRIQKAFEVCDNAEGALSATLQENLQGVRVVRAFARQGFESARFDARNLAHSGAAKRLIDLFGQYWGISVFLSMAQGGVVLVLGAQRAASGSITVGTLVVFLSYVGRLLWPVRQLGRTLTELGKARVSLGRLAAILGEASEFDDDGDLEPCLRGGVEFEDVRFSYEPGRPVLDGVSFSVKPGETVAILGKTGSGKSTIAHLAARLADPDSGTVRLSGVDARLIRKRHVRDRVGIVLQEPFLFSKSIRDNVLMGARLGPVGPAVPEGADPARSAAPATEPPELLAAAEVAGLAPVVAGFDGGWDTMVGEEGVTLSGGQRQRAAIARTLVRKPDVLVLDDSLSAVDTETDAAIRAALSKERGGVTTIIVAHRLTTLAGADRVIVLEGGRVADSGTHAELISREGLYRRVWEIQSGLERENAEPEERSGTAEGAA